MIDDRIMYEMLLFFKLTLARAKDLVYAQNYHRLLSRSSDEYNEEKQECGILTKIALTHFRVPVF